MIKRINIINFGKLSDLSVTLSGGLNIIYGKNEDGKTTLLEFVKFVFYGSRQKKAKGELTVKERYMPWNGMPMSGSIELEYDGQEYIIYRAEGTQNGSKELDIKNPRTGERYLNIDDPGHFFFGIGENEFSHIFLSGDTDTFFELSEDVSAIVYGMDDSHLSYGRTRRTIEDQILNISSTKRSGSDYSRINDNIRSVEEKLLTIEKEIDSLNSDFSHCMDEKEKLKEKYEYLSSKLINMQKKEKEDELARILLMKKNEADNLRHLRDRYNSIKREDNGADQKRITNRFVGASFAVAVILIAMLTVMMSEDYKKTLLWVIPVLILFGVALWKISILYGIKEKNRTDHHKGDEYGEILLGQIELSQMRVKEYTEDIKRHSLVHDVTVDIHKTNFDNINTFTKEEINGIINDIYVCETDIKVLDAHIKSAAVKKQELMSDKENCMQKLSHQKERLKRLEHEVKVQKAALSILDSAFFAMRDQIAPEISKRAFEIFSKVNAGRYQSLVTDDKFDTSINIGGQLKSVKNFSRSTRDLAALSLRIAICDALSQKSSLPMFFDDVLSSFDDERCFEMLDCIKAVSKERQVFFCTCREREVTTDDSKTIVIKLGKDDNNG